MATQADWRMITEQTRKEMNSSKLMVLVEQLFRRWTTGRMAFH